MAWGRNAALAETGPAPRRAYGLISILLALAAPVLVIAAFAWLISFENGSESQTEYIATIVALATFGLVAPVMHLIGVAFGIAGTVSPNANKVASVIGIILNVALVAMGLGLGWFAIQGMGAFT